MSVTDTWPRAPARTEADFLAALAALGFTWQNENGRLRSGWGTLVCCPISALYFVEVGERKSITEYAECAQALGLSPRLAERIMLASDYRDGHDPALRAKLRAACGLFIGRAPKD